MRCDVGILHVSEVFLCSAKSYNELANQHVEFPSRPKGEGRSGADWALLFQANRMADRPSERIQESGVAA